MDASVLSPYGIDLDILQPLTCILLLAIVVVLRNKLLILFEMYAFAGVGIDGRGMWSLEGLCKYVKRVLLLHC